MATLSDLIVKLSLDSSKFSQGLNGTVQSLSKLQTKFKDSKTGIVDFGKVSEALRSNAQLLSDKFNLQSARLENLKQKYREVCETEGEDSEAAQRLAIQIGALERNMQTLQGRIDAVNNDIDVNNNRLYQVGTNMQGVGDKLRQVGTRFGEVGKTLTTRLTAPIVGVGAATVKVTADFDSAMSEVSAISGATGDDFDSLREKAIEMGSRTKFSASESAEAMKYMAMAGWNSEQMLSGLEGVMNAAAASGEDLGSVSDILTDGLTAFGMAASDSGRMADVLTAAATSSNTTIGLLGDTFKYTAPVCGTLGASLEDCALATGLMANAGIKGSQAGTSLRTGLTNLINPSSSVAKAMAEYGITLQTNADGSANLSATMKLLRDRLSGLSDTERAAALAAMFGQDAVSGWSAIVTASDSDFNSLADAIANSTGKAEEIANLRLDNLSGQLTLLKSAVEGIAIQIGNILMPAVSSVVSWVQSLATAFSNLSDGTKKTIVAVAGIVAAIGPVVAVIGAALSAIGGVVSAIGGVVAAVAEGTGVVAAIGGAFSALAGPIAIVVAAVVAVTIAIVTALTKFEWFNSMVGGIKEAIASAFGSIMQTASELKNNLVETWDKIQSHLQSVTSLIKDNLLGAFDAFKGRISDARDFINELSGKAGELLENLGPLATMIRDNLSENIKKLSGPIGTIKTAFKNVGDVIVNNLGPVLRDVLMPLFEQIAPVIKTVASVFGGVLIPTIGIAIGFISGVCNALAGFAELFAGIVEVVSGVFELIVGIFTLNGDICNQAVQDIVDGVVNCFSGLWDSVSGFVQGFVDGVVGFFQGLWDTLVGHSIVPDTIDGIINCFSGLWDGVSGFVSDFVNGVIGAFTSVKGFFEGLWNGISTFFTTIWMTISTTVTTFCTTVWTTISTIFNSVKQTVSTAMNAIKTTVSTAWNAINTATTTAWNAVKTAVTTPINAARTAVSTAINAVKSAVSSAWNSVKSATSSTWNAIKTAITTPINAAKDAVKRAIDRIKSFFHFSWSLPKLKLPHFSVSGSFSLNPPSVPHFGISWYRNGAIFAKPTLFDTASGLKGVGEAGAEAVLPLTSLWRELDRRLNTALANVNRRSDDTQMLEAIKAGFADVVSCLSVDQPNGGEVVLKLMVDGKELAAVVTPYVDKNLAHKRALAGRYV